MELRNRSNLPVGKLNIALSKSLTNSYKLYWMYAVFELCTRGERRFPVFKACIWMVVKNWYSTVYYRLFLGKQDQLGKLVDYIHKSYNFPDNLPEEQLYKNILSLYNKKEDLKLNKAIDDLGKYVPYRLISPFFEETEEYKVLTKDYHKNPMIANLSKSETLKSFYIIDDVSSLVEIRNEWMDYIIENHGVVEAWMKYHIINFLQKRNPNVPSIPNKITLDFQRNYRVARQLWLTMAEEEIIIDIYQDAALKEKHYSSYGTLCVDHFIPRRFVMHDLIWNLVPSFKNVNSSKNDQLPDLEQYFDLFSEIQYRTLKRVARSNNKRLFEEYLSLNSKYSMDLLKNEISKDQFKEDLYQTINPLYQIAKNQGFRVMS